MKSLLWMLLLIAAFLIGTFAYSYRLLQRHSKREEKIDKARLRPWDEEDG